MNIYVIIILFGVLITLGSLLLEPILPLYLVFYKSLTFYPYIHLTILMYFMSSFLAKIFLILNIKYLKRLVLLSLLLPISLVILTNVDNAHAILLARFMQGFITSILIVIIWIMIFITPKDLNTKNKCVGLYNASLGLSSAIAALVSYKLLYVYGLTFLTIISLIMSMIVVMLTLMLISQLRDIVHVQYTDGAYGEYFKYYLRRADFVVLSIMFTYVGYGLVRPYLPTFTMMLLDDVNAVLTILVIGGVIYAFSSIITSYLLTKFYSSWLIPLSLIGISIGGLIYRYSYTPEEFILGVVSTSASSAIFKVAFIAFALRIPPRLNIRLVIVLLALNDLGICFGSYLSYYVIAMNPRLLFSLYALLTATTALTATALLGLRKLNLK